MSSAFVHTPSYDSSGTPVDVWLRTNWDVSEWRGDDLIATHDGSTHPVKECAVVFRNFRAVTGRAGAYFADPVAVVQYRAAMLTSIKGDMYTHPIVRMNDVLVPLGTPNWTNPQTRIVLQQSARQWVAGGKNTADMSDSHVITLYYSALQQLVYNAGCASTQTEQQRWFPALVALTKAFIAIHAAYEAARKVTSALVYTPGANDMLQKGLAYVFHSTAEWTPAARLNMLAIAIRRNLRAGGLLTGTAPGPFVLFVLVPLLRTVCDGVLEASDTLRDRYNTAAAECLRAFATAGTDKIGTFVSLTAAMGAPLTRTQVSALLAHIASTSPSDEPDWVKMGVFAPPSHFDATIKTDRFDVVGRRAASYHVKVDNIAADRINVYSYKGVEWAAIGLQSPGTYTVRTHDLGIATAGVGDTYGRDLTANWRLTAGNDLLPRSRAGYSLAGEEHTRGPTGAWYYRLSAPLRLDAPFVITVKPTSVSLSAGHGEFFTMAKTAEEPALLAFKNLWLSVNYVAPPPMPAPTHVSTPVRDDLEWTTVVRKGHDAPPRFRTGAPTHTDRTYDLTPMSLIAKLHAVA